MKVIYIKENQKEIWNEFIAENNSESFLQSWEWGEFQKSIGRKIWRVAIVDNDDLRDFKHTPSASRPTPLKRGIINSKFHLMALIIKHDLPFGRSYFYCPRGPVVNESRIKNQESSILSFLFNEIKKIAEKEKSLFLRIDPAIDCWFHSPEGLWNQNAKLSQKGSTALKGLWSQHTNFQKSPSEIQPRDTLILDITKSEEELLKEMKQKTRYNIRLAGKKELRITNYELGTDNKKVFKEKFEEFWKLTEETSKRDKFSSHNKNYYWKMLEGLSDEICHSEFISESIAGAGLQPVSNVSCSGAKFCAKDKDETSKQKKLVTNQFPHKENLSKTQKAPRPCGTMEPANLAMTEGDIRECRLRARLYLAEYDNKIIAANIVLYFGDLAVYLHGASSNEYRNVMAPYLLQWRQILDAKKAGCKKYDFWGIASIVRQAHHDNGVIPELNSGQTLSLSKDEKNKKSDWGGITRFKKGFGGYEKNYIGAYDLVFSNIGYTIYGLIRKIKDIVKFVK